MPAAAVESPSMAKLYFYYSAMNAGKTTNLLRLHDLLAPELKGELMTMETQDDRTLFFDLLPLGFRAPSGLLIKFRLFTVPGQIAHDDTRKAVLSRADGVVFVADSQIERAEANLESVENLRANLAEQGYNLDKIPYVIQYNKRDLPNVATVEELRSMLNPTGVPDFEGVARTGVGVFDTLKAVAKLVLTELKKSQGG